jgi:hypothetical protein
LGQSDKRRGSSCDVRTDGGNRWLCGRRIREKEIINIARKAYFLQVGQLFDSSRACSRSLLPKTNFEHLPVILTDSTIFAFTPLLPARTPARCHQLPNKPKKRTFGMYPVEKVHIRRRSQDPPRVYCASVSKDLSLQCQVSSISNSISNLGKAYFLGSLAATCVRSLMENCMRSGVVTGQQSGWTNTLPTCLPAVKGGTRVSAGT